MLTLVVNLQPLHTPMSRDVLPLGTTTSALVRALQSEQHTALWQSPLLAGKLFLAQQPLETLTIEQGHVELHTDHESHKETESKNDPFWHLEQFARRHGHFCGQNNARPLIGFFSYDCGRFIENIDGSGPHAFEPDMHVAAFENWGEFDALSSELAQFGPQIFPIRDMTLALASCSQASSCTSNAEFSFASHFSRGDFVHNVERALDYIRAGDIFQVVLGNSFHISAEISAELVFAELAEHNPSPFHALLRFGDYAYVTASPELMLRAEQTSSGVRISVRPVAGTYPRVNSEDTAQLSQLQTDLKERAEHMMLVDHVRNDIGKLAQIGSVHVDTLCAVESYEHVHHIVSQVSGLLPAGQTAIDALRACFPISTLTGTPKIRAMEIIAELETSARGIFGGACFFLSPQSELDSCVAIRGATIGKHDAWWSTGAGIVSDSIPNREYDECLWKAQSLVSALSRSRIV